MHFDRKNKEIIIQGEYNRTCEDIYLRKCREGYGGNNIHSLASECAKCRKLTCKRYFKMY